MRVGAWTRRFAVMVAGIGMVAPQGGLLAQNQGVVSPVVDVIDYRMEANGRLVGEVRDTAGNLLSNRRVAEALADGTGVTLVVKPELGHTAAAVALDVTATVTGTGTARRYEMQALVTGEALSGLLNGLDEAVFSLQVAWGTEGAAGYGISEPLEIVVVNAYVRPGDELPDPLSDAAWEVFKERLVAGDGVTLTVDEVERTITIEADGGGTADVVSGDFILTVINGVTYQRPAVPVS